MVSRCASYLSECCSEATAYLVDISSFYFLNRAEKKLRDGTDFKREPVVFGSLPKGAFTLRETVSDKNKVAHLVWLPTSYTLHLLDEQPHKGVFTNNEILVRYSHLVISVHYYFVLENRILVKMGLSPIMDRIMDQNY